jgi:hypothetical protein
MTYTVRRYLDPAEPQAGPGNRVPQTPVQAEQRMAAIIEPLVAQIQGNSNDSA